MAMHIVLSSNYDLCDSGHRYSDTPLLVIAGSTRQLRVILCIGLYLCGRIESCARVCVWCETIV